MQALLKSALFLSLLSSCAALPNTSFEVSYGDRQALSFIGKGAAAGMMLDSVLGGAGIAIGIAIDEGIAKDMAKSIYIYDPKYDFLAIVKKEIQKSKKITIKNKQHLTGLVVSRYGFRTFSGHKASEYKDAVSPWLSLTFYCVGSTLEVNYPEDIGQPLISELQGIKDNGQLAADQLRIAVDQAIDHWVDLGACAIHQ